MSFFPACQTVLYTISTALLYPVVISLILLTVWLLVHSGGFAGEWIKRRRMTADAADAMEAICEQRALPAELAAELPYPVAAYAEKLSKLAEEGDRFTAERVESLNQKAQLERFREVDRIRLMVRIGPSLGLMGTLIPMGTGLAGLTQGNMAQLSSSLILAFTTTVVGLFWGSPPIFFGDPGAVGHGRPAPDQCHHRGHDP